MATGEGLREVARGGRRRNCALVPIRGFRQQGKSALRPPHPFPRPREPRGRRLRLPSAPPLTHCSCPRAPGTRTREPGPQRRRLTLAMLAPARSHMDFYNLAWPRRRAARRSWSDQERETAERGQRGEVARRWRGARPAPSAERRGRAGRGRGGGARRSPDTRVHGRSLARSPAQALTHIPSIPEEPGGAAAGTWAPPRGAAESRVRASSAAPPGILLPKAPDFPILPPEAPPKATRHFWGTRTALSF